MKKKTVRDYAAYVKPDPECCRFIAVRDGENWLEAWYCDDMESLLRGVMDRVVISSKTVFAAFDDDGNGIWPGIELEI